MTVPIFKTYIATGTDRETGDVRAVYGGKTTQPIDSRAAQHKMRDVCEHHGWRLSFVVVGVHPDKETMSAAEDALIESLFEAYGTICLNETRKSPTVQAAKNSKPPKSTRWTGGGGSRGMGSLPRGVAIHYPPQPQNRDDDPYIPHPPYAVISADDRIVGDVVWCRIDENPYWMPSSVTDGYSRDVIFWSFASAVQHIIDDYAKFKQDWGI